ncbi:uncharacterized protein LOC136095570 [Hydra vulgaris]|uniref:uncharacterized protein LOC136095570 n=1 Tax=Hydra vulgaris TaxID=6087 RepID=UPI0032EA7313
MFTRNFYNLKIFHFVVIGICGYKFFVDLNQFFLHPPDFKIEAHIVESLKRLQFLKNSLTNFSSFIQPNPEIAIVIISSERDYEGVNLDYPFQTVGTLFLEMKHTKKKFGFLFCNTTYKVNDYLGSLDSLIGLPYIYKFTNILATNDKQGRWQKELLDYISCLVEAKKRYPYTKYFLFNEDDGLIINGFYDSLNNVVSQIDFLSLQDKRQRRKISHVKLFHPLRLRKIPWFIYLLVVPILFLSIVKMISFYFSFPISKLFLLATFLLSFSFLFGLGPNKVGFLHYAITNNIALVNQESCCTVSILFPLYALDETIQYLIKESKISIETGIYRAKDTILDELPLKTDMDVLMTEFNLVEHIGMFSTKKKNS